MSSVIITLQVMCLKVIVFPFRDHPVIALKATNGHLKLCNFFCQALYPQQIGRGLIYSNGSYVLHNKSTGRDR